MRGVYLSIYLSIYLGLTPIYLSIYLGLTRTRRRRLTPGHAGAGRAVGAASGVCMFMLSFFS